MRLTAATVRIAYNDPLGLDAISPLGVLNDITQGLPNKNDAHDELKEKLLGPHPMDNIIK